ncbi:hypothetical protein [Brevibacillus porteri]|uniref:hypothetical protein n=1 Tax=Brevibacillus porteri TaxID=2126350 RepID=UPI00363C586B
MTQFFDQEQLQYSLFDWKDVHGKQLTILVTEGKKEGSDDVITLVYGKDKKTDKLYLLHYEGI